MSSAAVWRLSALALTLAVAAAQQSQQPTKRVDPHLMEELCRNFSHGNPTAMEFYSPVYPRNYPSEINCFRIITADIGYFVRIDFRDMFRIEPPNTAGVCEYDYLEIRDGDQGYSPLIGKYCGDKFPPIITSSGRSLWLRFSSDSTIQYTGFKAAYTFIENPLNNVPDIEKCTFKAGGFQDFIGTANISADRFNHSLTYDVPIDCVWTIRAQKNFKIYLQFPEYELVHPNDCHLNYIQSDSGVEEFYLKDQKPQDYFFDFTYRVFDEKTDEEHRLKNFCGSVAESVTSSSNVMYVRFYAEKTGISSVFVSVFTSMRVLESNEVCDAEEEYDCDDATCIDPDLVCNGIRNCKFGWDEESCDDGSSTLILDFSSFHVIMIILFLMVILLGLVAGMVWNLLRRLAIDKEEIHASREKSLASQSLSNCRVEDCLPQQLPPLQIAAAPITIIPRQRSDSGECYVPDGGYAFGSRL